jgi:acyl-CoA thioester hydrolase
VTIPVRRPTHADERTVHTCFVSVRSYECDAYGHVNNAVYLNYLEYARHEYLRDIGVAIGELRNAGYSLLIAKVAIEYRRPAVTDDNLRISTTLVRQTTVGGVLRQLILNEGSGLNGTPPAVIAEAEVTWVCVDSRGRPARLPPEFPWENPPS